LILPLVLWRLGCPAHNCWFANPREPANQLCAPSFSQLHREKGGDTNPLNSPRTAGPTPLTRALRG
jgi:hypothetical protein